MHEVAKIKRTVSKKKKILVKMLQPRSAEDHFIRNTLFLIKWPALASYPNVASTRWCEHKQKIVLGSCQSHSAVSRSRSRNRVGGSQVTAQLA